MRISSLVEICNKSSQVCQLPSIQFTNEKTTINTLLPSGPTRTHRMDRLHGVFLIQYRNEETFPKTPLTLEQLGFFARQMLGFFLATKVPPRPYQSYQL